MKSMMMKTFRQLRVALKETFSRPEGWIAAVSGFVFVLLVAMILANLKLLAFIFHDSQFSPALKASSALETIWAGRLAFKHEGGWATIALAFFFGLNAAFIERYMRRQVQMHHVAGTSLIGILVGLLGVGCASCGTALLASLLGAGATFGVIKALPFHGREFAWLGILLVAVSTLVLAKKIAEPDTCAIPQKR